MLATGIRLLGISEEQFWDMTLKEYALQIEGYRWRLDQERIRDAWIVATLINFINPQKKAVTINYLLGIKEKKKTKEEVSAEKAETLLRLGQGALISSNDVKLSEYAARIKARSKK